MPQFIDIKGQYCLEVMSHDSFEDINQKLLDYCDSTMKANGPNAHSEYPVYCSGQQIGWVRLGLNENASEYVIRHFSLDRQELENDWHPCSFYKGDYGYKLHTEEA